MTLIDKIHLLHFLLKHDKETTVETFTREVRDFELRERTQEYRDRVISSATPMVHEKKKIKKI